MSQNSKNLTLFPLMLCFLAMGFVDLVGIASNYVKDDLSLTDAQANLFPSLVFFWFLLFAVPTSMLMNKIGRKKTVLLSLVITALALIIPIIGETYEGMLVAFSLLGIGNTLMQTSCNPLLATIVSGEKLASSLTFGQFVKAISSFMAPYLAMWGAIQVIPEFGLGWRVLFPIFLIVGLVALLLLGITPIEEEKSNEKTSSFMDCMKLLGTPVVLFCFIGIMTHVGLDVGVNTTAPKILMERLGWTLNDAAFATSLYFIFRTIGCLTGSIILQKMSKKVFFAISSCMVVSSMALLTFADTTLLLYVAIALVGYGNCNLFTISLATAMQAVPTKKNEVSGLMFMGLIGGTIYPLAMGYASDAMQGQMGAVVVMLVGSLYLLFLATQIKK